ncbi:hypothetical protein CYLTODRAFT_420720 [Cylindrobasidium torrendii FP15055 ss-10]|uniref:Protein CPL1-like domain-containing protein n=1 Tax=Cylindrobasidium torrendii FP15055 ss-10 TaxID=1314674 RepID=A0A0D7BGX1_9AGAR|nr:hypothetical protein CYLTODRAFT_420720 [Cylindrobasidium torrendii FP15055 ss-10]
MRFVAPALVFLASFVPATLSASPGTLAHVSRSRVVSERQFHPNLEQRQLLDICLHVDADVILGTNGGILSPVLNALLADLDLCLCLKDLNIFLSTKLAVDVQKLLNSLNLNLDLSVLLNTLFQNAPPCPALPPHAARLCSNKKPCDIECKDGFVRQGDTCVCPAPNQECNGRCVAPGACGSAVPNSNRLRRNTEISTLSRAKATCAEHASVCGVPGASKRAYECIDTQSSAESCGGCATPHGFAPRELQSLGQNCLAAPQVAGASCRQGACVVECKDGFVPSKDSTACVARRDLRRRDIIADLNSLGIDIVADIDLGSGLNKLVTDLAKALGLDSLIYDGEKPQGDLLSAISLLIELCLRLDLNIHHIADTTHSGSSPVGLDAIVNDILDLVESLLDGLDCFGKDVATCDSLEKIVDDILKAIDSALALDLDNATKDLVKDTSLNLGSIDVLLNLVLKITAARECGSQPDLLAALNDLLHSLLKEHKRGLDLDIGLNVDIGSTHTHNGGSTPASGSTHGNGHCTESLLGPLLRDLGLDNLLGKPTDDLVIDLLDGLGVGALSQDGLLDDVLSALGLGTLDLDLDPLIESLIGGACSTTPGSPTKPATGGGDDEVSHLLVRINALLKVVVNLDGLLEALGLGASSPKPVLSANLIAQLDAAVRVLLDATLDIGTNPDRMLSAVNGLLDALNLCGSDDQVIQGLLDLVVRLVKGLLVDVDALVGDYHSCGCGSDAKLLEGVQKALAGFGLAH